MSSNKLLIIGSPYRHPNKVAFTKKFIRLLSTVSGDLVYVGANAPQQTPQNVKVEYIEFKRGNNILERSMWYTIYQSMSAKIFESKNYDSVIIRPQHFLLLAIYLRLRRERFAVFAAQAQESDLMKKISRATFRVADSLIIESTGTYGWHPQGVANKCFDGRTYVDLDRFQPLSSKNNEHFTVGYLGLLSERKGVPRLLEAIKILNSNNEVKFKFKFGGSGDYEQEVAEAAQNHENLSFHGFVSDEKLADFYREMDVVVLPSLSEGLPNVVLEAMACGTPPLVTPVGGIPQLVEDGLNGFILPDRKPKTIASELVKLHQNVDIDTVSRTASATVQSNYSREKAIERYRDIVESLCGNQR